MPKWIHDRARHLLAKNPDMDKGQAFAIATQQSHKMGKTPKGYGTSEGKSTAKKKYDKPKKSYSKSANPGGLDTPKLDKDPGRVWKGDHFVEKKSGVERPKVPTSEVADHFAKPPPGKTKKLEVDLEKEAYDERRLVIPHAFFDELAKLGGIKEAFQQSQYSGDLGPGRFDFYASGIPPFRKPQLKTGGPPSEGDKDKAAAVTSPKAQLTSNQKIGKPKSTTPPGPSIAQQSKPTGFGTPLAGAKKGNNII